VDGHAVRAHGPRAEAWCKVASDGGHGHGIAIAFDGIYITGVARSGMPRIGCIASGRPPMKASFAELLRRLPGPATAAWPMGERFVRALSHGSMSVELYAPASGDPQEPHDQDELYFIHSGRGVLRIDHERHTFAPGDCFFVAAGVEHRFEQFSDDFATWVVFWGPIGGESA
jgi:mannose-6-phosphate isomerase-like protein (cupin superfamily)